MQGYHYLDSNANTPVPRDVLRALNKWCTFGNPSCSHPPALVAAKMVEDARAELLRRLGASCASHCCILTSGGSEANSSAILGALLADCLSPRSLSSSNDLRDRFAIVSSHAEHPSVLDLLSRLEASGRAQVVYAPVLPDGRVDLSSVLALVRELGARLAIVQHANSELGSVNDVAWLSSALLAHAPGCLLHVDAVQTFTKLPLRIASNMSVSASAHKFHGPCGVGFLAKPRRVELFPLVSGKQNDGLRGGTLNSPAVGAMLAAVRFCDRKSPLDPMLALEAVCTRARVELYFAHEAAVVRAGVAVLSARERLPNTCSFALVRPRTGFVCGSWLKGHLERRKVIVSNGSACQTGKPSPLVDALRQAGLHPDFTKGLVRVSASRLTLPADLRALALALAEVFAMDDSHF